MNSTIFHKIATGTLIVATLLVFYVSYLLFWPVKILVYANHPFTVLNDNKTVKAGDILIYEVDYCKYKNVSAMIDKQFINDVILETPDLEGNLTVGCFQKTSMTTLVPIIAPPGKYHLNIIATYRVNSLRTEVITHETEEFTVIK